MKYSGSEIRKFVFGLNTLLFAVLSVATHTIGNIPEATYDAVWAVLSFQFLFWEDKE